MEWTECLQYKPGGPGGPSMMPVGNCPSLLIVVVYPLSPLSPLSPESPVRVEVMKNFHLIKMMLKEFMLVIKVLQILMFFFGGCYRVDIWIM